MIATFYALYDPTRTDSYWRVTAPAKAIGARVAAIPPEDAEAILTQPNSSSSLPWKLKVVHPDGNTSTIKTPLGWKRFNGVRRKVRSLTAEFPLHEGTAVFTRPPPAAAVLAASMRGQGIRTVAESDDNYFAHRFNIVLRMIEDKEEDAYLHAASMVGMDACIFSTYNLRDYYYKELKERFGKRRLPDLHVCRNSIDERDWPTRIERDGPLRVGFMGSSSHAWDINVTYGAFRTAKELGCTTHMIGYNPGAPEVEGELTEKAKANIATWATVVDKYTKWMSSEEFREHGLPLDIALCPLKSDSFTLGKSDVKAIEATISGAAVICSNNPVFNGEWKHEETCLVATTDVDYALAVKRLVMDPKLRFELVTNAQEYVASKRGLKQMQSEWREAVAA